MVILRCMYCYVALFTSFTRFPQFETLSDYIICTVGSSMKYLLRFIHVLSYYSSKEKDMIRSRAA